MAKKVRLDELLVERGLVDSRSQSKALIMTGKVRQGDRRLDKPGLKVENDIELYVESGPRFVSRGGEKLLGFIEAFGVEFEGRRVLDVGASTGGFSDCSLQHGASHVTCVDVGRGQLHLKVAGDDRVINLEKVNARHLKTGDLPHDLYDRIVMDLSFISLKAVLPAVWEFLAKGGVLIALVKPQFEVGKEIADKFRGVIKDVEAREAAYASVENYALENLEGARKLGSMESPIKGTDGNVEYLLGLERAGRDQ